jgi:hypothetical protein
VLTFLNDSLLKDKAQVSKKYSFLDALNFSRSALEKVFSTPIDSKALNETLKKEIERDIQDIRAAKRAYFWESSPPDKNAPTHPYWEQLHKDQTRPGLPFTLIDGNNTIYDFGPTPTVFSEISNDSSLSKKEKEMKLDKVKLDRVESVVDKIEFFTGPGVETKKWQELVQTFIVQTLPNRVSITLQGGFYDKLPRYRPITFQCSSDKSKDFNLRILGKVNTVEAFRNDDGAIESLRAECCVTTHLTLEEDMNDEKFQPLEEITGTLSFNVSFIDDDHVNVTDTNLTYQWSTT